MTLASVAVAVRVAVHVAVRVAMRMAMHMASMWLLHKSMSAGTSQTTKNVLGPRASSG